MRYCDFCELPSDVYEWDCGHDVCDDATCEIEHEDSCPLEERAETVRFIND